MGNAETGRSTAVEVRPAYVDDWLDTLPYADFDKTAALLHGALSAVNTQRLKPAQRFELLNLYVRPYRYLLGNYAKTEVLPGAHALEAKQRTVDALRHVALDMAFACRLSIEETLNRKTLWVHNKPSPRQLLLAVRLLSHVLLLSYQAYSPVPGSTWSELHENFLIADQLGLLSALAEDPLQDSRSRTSVLNAFLQIAATSLMDPHHLPQGAVWQIYEQLHDWAREIQLTAFRRPPDTHGYFVIDLKGSSRPVNLARFDAACTTPYHRLMKCAALYRVVQLHRERAAEGYAGDASLVLPPKSADLLLRQMLSAWGEPPTRHAPRRPRRGTLRLAAGLNAAFFHVNGGRDFLPRRTVEDPPEIEVHDGGAYPRAGVGTIPPGYVLESWSFLNEGPGGFAVFRSALPGGPIRVGELVSLEDPDAGYGRWMLGVVRWLMVYKHHEHRIGLQVIGRRPRCGAVRAAVGSRGEREYRRALLVECPLGTGSASLIAARGLYAAGRSLELDIDGGPGTIRPTRLIETTVAFEQFSFQKLA